MKYLMVLTTAAFIGGITVAAAQTGLPADQKPGHAQSQGQERNRSGTTGGSLTNPSPSRGATTGSGVVVPRSGTRGSQGGEVITPGGVDKGEVGGKAEGGGN